MAQDIVPVTPVDPVVPEEPRVLPDWLQNIYDGGGNFELTDEDILAIGQYLLYAGVQDQVANQQYKEDFLNLKNKELGLNDLQLQQAQKEFEFQSGPYWDWYSGEYMDFQKQQAANQMAMSDNQVKMSDNQVAISGDDVLKSKNYLQQSRYNTDQALMGLQMAKYNAWAQLGMIPESKSLSQGGKRGFAQTMPTGY